ncbi:MAG: endolytic transglycosylase MltG [Burkholderiales bacterium]|nr:MAG: endolytic transglycosylase MltG [Burkholderiales bacterium]
MSTSSTAGPDRAPLARKWLLSAVLSVPLLALALVASLVRHAYLHAPLLLAGPRIELRIERGASAQRVAAAVRASGIEVPAWWFLLVARLRGDLSQLKAGFYAVEAPVTLRALLDRITRGEVTLSEFRLIEGWSFRQLREALAGATELRQELPTLSSAELLARIGASEPHPEGLFAPDTYRFERDSSDVELLARAYRRQKTLLEKAWVSRDPTLPYASPYEVLIMASIIEKETGRAADRPLIAAVFVNRLRKGMLLQSDPTTIYGLGSAFDGNLRRADLRRDTEYNTYTRSGLPPTPIAMPGQASLEAALAPADSPVLYFVARGDGSSEFSLDLRSHNRAVNRYQKRR